ncbi:MAG: putative LPS assembly protein LptD, partial [Bacteroidota bacterium]|nr:putative LPS assembly protein LptD [Bacteroidota bacterium]
GNFSGGYSANKIGEEGTSDYTESTDFSIRWTHRQDPKARPNSQFSANVNIVTSNYSKNNPVSAQNYLSNTFSSSISYQTNFNNRVFLTASANHSQNTLNRTVDVTLPQVAVSVSRIYPFKRKHRAGEQKWYEKITVGYSMDTKNTIRTYDTLLTFDREMFDRFKNGMKHSIPISSSVKVLKYFNLSNSINFTERWYTQSISNQFIDELIYAESDTTYGYVKTDTASGFYALHEFSYSASLNTRLYGMVNFKKGPVKALRHVMSPNLSFSYHPDFGSEYWGYYDTYYDKNRERDVQYSYYNDGIYGKPSAGESGSVSFSLGNNLEMKVKSKNDSTSDYKKVKLIESLSFRMSYNLAADSLNLSRLSVSGRTKLFKKLNVTYSSAYDPYVINSEGRRINEFVWNAEKKLFRRDNTSWNFGLNLSFSDKDMDKLFESDKGSDEELDQINRNPDDYINWDNTWKLNLDYTLRYTNSFEKMLDKYNRDFIQTLGFGGSINITDKWKVAVRSGYDFKGKDFSYTSVNINRNLHCWSMHFNWIPFGYRQSWNFTIQANSSLLQDLKLEKKKDFRDY